MNKHANAVGRVARHDQAVSIKDNADVNSTDEINHLVDMHGRGRPFRGNESCGTECGLVAQEMLGSVTS